MKTSGKGRVSAAIDHEIALERPIAGRRRLCPKRRFDAKVWPKPIEGERGGVELGVGGRLEQLARVVLEELVAGVERHDLHAPRRGGELRLREVIAEMLRKCCGLGGLRRQRVGNQETKTHCQ